METRPFMLLAVATGLLIIAYSATVTGAAGCDLIALTLTAVSTLIFAASVAAHEAKVGSSAHHVLKKIAAKGVIPYIATAAAILLAAMVATLQIASPVWIKLPSASLPVIGVVVDPAGGEVEKVMFMKVPVRLPLPLILVTSMVLAYLARPVLSDKARLAAVILASPTIAYCLLLFTALYIPGSLYSYPPLKILQIVAAMYSKPETWRAIAEFLSVSLFTTATVTAAFAYIFTLFIELMKHMVIVRKT